MTFSDEMLMAYADGELDAAARSAIEAAMASDPQIARRVAQHSALRNRFRSAFDRILDEPVPPRLLMPASGVTGTVRGKVVPLRQPRQWAWPQWTAIAASLIVGVIVGGLAMLRARAPDVVAMTGGQALAAGSLAHALSDQLAGSRSSASSVGIGVSFRSKSGQFCRTFVLRQPAALAGLACRAPQGWQIGVLARTELAGGNSGGYRQAASAMPPAVIAAVGNQTAGEPLDARAEAAARARHWQP
ncbi:MAG TPA: hypothetical protein VGN43_04900 [Steroidobacteraceae bacterium]|jgi:hypothetical protein|nr:hypothetical protein [Steroidobacteraceae bacterium]